MGEPSILDEKPLFVWPNTIEFLMRKVLRRVYLSKGNNPSANYI
jgi:hypothetical protein